MKPPPRSENQLKIEAGRLGLIGRNSNLDTPRKKLINHLWQSYSIKRGIGHASILMFGSSGVGKSSTINHIFDLKENGINFAETSDSKSETRVTTEYNIFNDDPSFDVKDISLGIVDSPGLNDTDGLKQDACNFYSIKKFYQEHPTSGYCYPNLIFILIKAGDNRFDGPNSSFVKSLKCLLKLNLVDTRHPNVVGVMTHAASLARKPDKWKANFEKKRDMLKDIIFKYLNVEADVIALENHADDEDLEAVGDYTMLPDGTLQPQNMYSACKRILQANNDDYGLIAFNSAFTSKKDRISIGFTTVAKDAKKQTLNKEEQIFLDFFEQTVRGEGIDDPLIRDAHEYIQERSLQSTEKQEVLDMASKLKQLGVNKKDVKDLSIDNLRFFTDLDTKSRIKAEYLQHLGVVDRRSVNLDDNVRVLAQGYDVLKDRTLPAVIFDYSTRNTNCGILVPSPARFAKVNTTATIAETFESKDELVRSRLHHLNLGIDVNYKMFSFSSRAGFSASASQSVTATSKEFSVLLEHRMFEVSMANFLEMSFTEDFRHAAQNLPNEFVVSDPENRVKFEKFFDKWGHFDVTKAFGGGSVEIKVNSSSLTSDSSSSSSAQAELIAAFSSGLFNASGTVSGGQNNAESNNYKRILSQSQMMWQGGDPSLHHLATLENPELLAKWKLSLMSSPCMLDTDLCLAPISELVGLVSPDREDSCYKALENFLGGNFKSWKDKEEKARLKAEQEKEKAEEEKKKAPTRKDDAKPPEDKGSNCFPGSAVVRRLKDGAVSDIQMKYLEVGDLVETKKGFSKVLMFAHYAPDKMFSCLKISTVDGYSVRLSGNHLIFISSTKQTKMACEVNPGDKLILRRRDTTGEVSSVERITEAGFYCPITEDGSLYVDGVLTSCYASCRRFAGVDGHYLAHLGLYPIRLINIKPSSNQEEMHPYVQFLDKLPLPFKV